MEEIIYFDLWFQRDKSPQCRGQGRGSTDKQQAYMAGAESWVVTSGSRERELEIRWGNIFSKPTLNDILPPARLSLLSLPQTAPPTEDSFKYMSLRGEQFLFKPSHSTSPLLGITDVCRDAWFMRCWGWFCACQASILPNESGPQPHVLPFSFNIPGWSFSQPISTPPPPHKQSYFSLQIVEQFAKQVSLFTHSLTLNINFFPTIIV